MIHHFDHRFATYERDGTIRDTTLEEHQDPNFAPMPRYWVEESEVENRLIKRDREGNVLWRWEEPWLVGLRAIARSTDERTMISTTLPIVAAGNSMPLTLFTGDSAQALLFTALTSSLAFDYLARQVVGGSNLNLYILKQLPLPAPSAFMKAESDWLVQLAIGLQASDNRLAHVLGSSDNASWEPDARKITRAWLDAFAFSKLGYSAAEVEAVLNTFSALRNAEVHERGTYQTKELILDALKAEPWK